MITDARGFWRVNSDSDMDRNDYRVAPCGTVESETHRSAWQG